MTDVWIIGPHLNNAALHPRLALDELVADDVLRVALKPVPGRDLIDHSGSKIETDRYLTLM